MTEEDINTPIIKDFSFDEYISAIQSIVSYLSNISFHNDIELGSYNDKLKGILKKTKNLNLYLVSDFMVKELYEKMIEIKKFLVESEYYSYGNDEYEIYSLNDDEENDILRSLLISLEDFIVDIQSEIIQDSTQAKEGIEVKLEKTENKLESLIDSKNQKDFYVPIEKRSNEYSNLGWILTFGGMIFFVFGACNGCLLEILASKTYREVFEQRFFIMFWMFGFFFVYQGVVRLKMAHQLYDFVLRYRNIENRENLLNPEQAQEVRAKSVSHLIEARLFEINSDKISYKKAIKILKDCKEIVGDK